MKSENLERIEITSAEARYLTLGSWAGIRRGYEIEGYCHECDKIDAVLEVADYFLDSNTNCVVAEGNYKCCGSVSAISFGILDKELQKLMQNRLCKR